MIEQSNVTGDEVADAMTGGGAPPPFACVRHAASIEGQAEMAVANAFLVPAPGTCPTGTPANVRFVMTVVADAFSHHIPPFPCTSQN